MRFRIKAALSALLLTAGSTLSNQAADVFAPGYLKYEYFGGIAGAVVSGLTTDARYISNTPDVVLWMTALDSRTVLPDDTHETYGARITGYVIPTVTGDYDFFIKSDDASQIFVSTDSTTNNLVKVAEETGCCNAFLDPGAAQTTAAPLHLVAGSKYALRVLLKEGGGGDVVQVAWRNTEDPTAAIDLQPIPGQYLGADVPSAVTPAVAISTQPQSTTVLPGSVAVFSVGYTSTPATIPQIGTPVGTMVTNNLTSFSTVQWYRDGVLIPGATGASYAVLNPQASDNNAKFSAKLGVLGSATKVTSSDATLTVSSAAAGQPSSGFLMYEYYGGITTAVVQPLLDDPRYQANTPDSILWMNSFDSSSVLPDNGHENYGARITGFIVPTETADYDFFLTSDDASQLYLSTDETTANLALIAEETGCCNPFREPGATSPNTTAAPINLQAGQRYAVQGLLKEGGGGDYIRVAWRKTTDTTPAAALKPIPAGYLAAYTGAGAALTITNQPASITVAENAPATFTIGFTGASVPPAGQSIGNMVNPLSVIWYKNGVVVPEANGSTYTIALAKPADNNAKITAKIGIAGGLVATSEATLTVTTDTVAPTIASARADSTLTNITIVFSEPITAATATALANYQVGQGLTITGITQVNPTTVRLGTSLQGSGTPYIFTINNLKDTASTAGGNIIAANSKVTVTSFTLATGALRVDRYFNVTAALDTFADPDPTIADPRYPNNPDDTVYWTVFGPFSAGNNYGDNYAARATGWIVPPTTGDYKFFLRSDDASRLSLSTDESPTNLVQIAAQTGCCNAFTDSEGVLSSSPITLTAGKRYFVEGLLKEGGGDDYLQVAWNTPDSPDLNSVAGLVPIPGQYLQTYIDPIASIQITQQPTNQTVAANTGATFSVGFTATNSSLGGFGSVQWQKAPAGSSTFTNIPGATSTTYTAPFVDPTDNGAQYRAVASVLTFASATSTPATLTVLPDSVPPTVVSVAGSDTTVTVTFNEPVDSVTGGNKANYTIDQGVTVTAANVVSVPGTGVVQLTLGGAQIGTTYHITVSGVKDRSGNTMIPFSGAFPAFNSFNDFNSAVLSSGATLSGNAKILPTGVLELTPAAGSMLGGLLIPDLANGGNTTNFLMHLKLFLGEGAGNPADGFSISFGSDVPDVATGGESGDGTGLRFIFDTYVNTDVGQTSRTIRVNWGGVDIASADVSDVQIVNDRWVDVIIRLSADGTVDVIHDGTAYFTKLAVDGYFPIAGGRFLLQARTGGAFEAARIDDVSIIVNGNVTLPVIGGTAGTFNKPSISGRNVTISWTGAGTLQSSSTVDGTYTDVAGVTGTSIVVDAGTAASAKFYRLKN